MFKRSQVVCWKCQRAGKGVQLQNVRLPAISPKTGKPLKSDDYICTECIAQGFYKPDKWNSSTIPMPTREELDELLKQSQEQQEQPIKAEKDEPPAGDGFKDFAKVSENVEIQLEPPAHAT